LYLRSRDYFPQESSPGFAGIDTASTDYGQSTKYETHQRLYAQNIPGLENLNALDRLPPVGATLVALPMKSRAGAGRR